MERKKNRQCIDAHAKAGNTAAIPHIKKTKFNFKEVKNFYMTAKHLFQILETLLCGILQLEVEKDSFLYPLPLFKDVIQPYFYSTERKTP